MLGFGTSLVNTPNPRVFRAQINVESILALKRGILIPLRGKWKATLASMGQKMS
jgi:hypothetical protein